MKTGFRTLGLVIQLYCPTLTCLTTAPGFYFHFKEHSLSRHDCSRRSEPVTWIGYNFRTRSLLLYDVISDVVFTNSLRKFCCLNIAGIVKKVFNMGNCRL